MLASTVRLFTIGVYSKTEAQFFNQLIAAKIDTFCDIRNRRGMRGALYAFANSRRLQQKLASLGISYYHFRDLSPSDVARRAQKIHDAAVGMRKRARSELSPEFKRLYNEQSLARFNSSEFLERLRPETRKLVLFCVEADQRACHRSLLGDRLSADLGLSVTHL